MRSAILMLQWFALSVEQFTIDRRIVVVTPTAAMKSSRSCWSLKMIRFYLMGWFSWSTIWFCVNSSRFFLVENLMWKFIWRICHEQRNCLIKFWHWKFIGVKPVLYHQIKKLNLTSDQLKRSTNFNFSNEIPYILMNY